MAPTRLLLTITGSVLALSCSATSSDNSVSQKPSGDAGQDTAWVIDTDAELDALITDSGSSVGEVYAHSATSLYRLEPFGKTLEVIGLFDCVTADSSSGEGMWDIAIDKDGIIFGSVVQGLGSKLVRIDKNTAACTTVSSAKNLPNSLGFVPAGLLDPADEVLVGYSGSVYLRIDKSSGATKEIGNLNPNATGKSWSSSGDIVSIIGADTYLSAVLEDGSNSDDYILQVDPKTGKALKIIGNTHFSQLWGLAYWAGTAYGFSASGKLCSIDLATGQGTAIPIPNLPANTEFWGAGVTTSAPTVVPK